MDKSKQAQAEKLQIRLDKLLETKGKKQEAFEKSKKELNAVSKEIDVVKLKLFEILQSGSDDSAFSDWAKRKINENGNSVKSKNAISANPEKSISQNAENRQSQTAQNTQSPAGQNQQPNASQNRPPQTPQNQTPRQ
jgi:predicted nuclease with TOPRIM domain